MLSRHLRLSNGEESLARTPSAVTQMDIPTMPRLLLARRRFLQLAGVTALQVSGLRQAIASEAPTLTLFENESWQASVYCRAQASAQVKAAAKLLTHYCYRSTGVEVSLSDKVAEGLVRIQVGASEEGVLQRDTFDALDVDGFVIDFPDTQTIRILGGSDWGTEFGVYEFLERYLGVRWLLPGPKGEYVPRLQKVVVAPTAIRQQPVFTSRLLSGLRNEEQGIWARRQRQHGRIEFHHNLLNIFPPEQYTQTHPHFFPILKGRRFLPASNATVNWQPCFSADGLVEEAVKNICAYFARSPMAMSYSLGVNDGLGYCECELCLRTNGEQKNAAGLNTTSETYFAWANAVAEGVLKHYPDKWFGCLAYRAVAQAPSTCTVHPRIVPFLTDDRLKWAAPESAVEGKRLTEAWRKVTSQLGWYDYLYGTPYCVPRVYFRAMAGYYRYGAQRGVSAMYAEAYPNWGEGPKLYIALKLQWDPTLDVDALLREWCEKAVGEEAAPDLIAYYQLWEQFWTRTVVSSPWFSIKKNEYLLFGRPDYLDLISDEITRSRALLDAVMTKIQTPEQHARAAVLCRAFEYYEASVLSYTSRNDYKIEAVVRSASSKKANGDRKMSAQALSAKRAALVAEFQHDPVLQHPLSFERYPSLRW